MTDNKILVPLNLIPLNERMKSLSQPVVNPFIYKMKLTTMQKIQVAIMSVTIAPLRLILCLLTQLITCGFATLLTIGMPIYPKEPIGPIHQALCNTLRFICRCGIFCTGYHWLQVRGERASSKDAPILVGAPHSTMFDVIIALTCNCVPSMTSKIENYNVPVIGTLIVATQPIFICRKDPNSRQNAINEVKKRTKIPGKWPQILVYPEGTCGNRKALITFKAGAFIPGVPVQPIVLEYLNGLDTFTWTMDGPSFLKLFWLTLCQLQIKFRITYLPVYKPDEMEKKNPRLYANNVRAFIAKSLDIPCTDHSYEDCRLMQHAASLNLPMEVGVVEFTKLNKELGLTIDILKDRLSEFSCIAPDRNDGKINVEDLAKFLKLPVPVTETFQNLFNFYDQDQNGLLDFRQYVIGWSLITEATAIGVTTCLTDKVFGGNKDGPLGEKKFVFALEAMLNREILGQEIFKEIRKCDPLSVTYVEFCNFIKKRPEYSQLFSQYQEIKQNKSVGNDIFVSPGEFENVLIQRKVDKAPNCVNNC